MRDAQDNFFRNWVFLNYPFDREFESFSCAMHFAVIAAGLLPICAQDVTLPDRPRLEMLLTKITMCGFSIHDLSRSRGEGEENLARFNMPIELGMALYYHHSNRERHRCAFFVAESHDYWVSNDYHRFASDLAGLDPRHYNDERSLVASVYQWLREVDAAITDVSYAEMQEKYQEFQQELERIKGSQEDDRPTHGDAQELMYRMCTSWEWWDWRAIRWGRRAERPLPLRWRDSNYVSQYRLLDVDR